ncbi:MAG: insulinase family protein [Acidobacteria bacterium]|nr:insulinase family protein [Acidobacteriota bacterium]
MKTRRLFLTTLLALAVTLPAAGQVQNWKDIKFPPLDKMVIPEPQRVTLPNGMLVMLLEDHELPAIQVMSRIRAGSRTVPADKTGLGAVFGDVLRTGGTKTMTGDQIDDFLEARGARIETNLGETSGFAESWSLKQDFPEVFKVFADILRNPAFAEDKIAIAKNQVASTIARRNDNPLGIMFREFDKLVYGPDSPYARTPEFSTLEAVSQADLVAFHKKYFQPNRIILGVVGDFDSKDMLAKIKSAFGNWPKGPDVKDSPAAYQTTMKAGIYYIQKDDMTQSDIIMGHLGILKSNPDIFAVDVMNEAWGGGFAARLFSNVRSKKGLAYSVRGAIDSNYDYPGTFNVWMTTKTETTAAGIDALRVEIGDLSKTPLTEAEVQRAKESILNSFIFNYDSKEKVLGQQMVYAYYGFPADYLAQYRSRIEKVTTDDVTRVAKKYVHEGEMAILVVGPPKGQDRPLSSFGKVVPVDITIPKPKAPGGSASKKSAP